MTTSDHLVLLAFTFVNLACVVVCLRKGVNTLTVTAFSKVTRGIAERHEKLDERVNMLENDVETLFNEDGPDSDALPDLGIPVTSDVDDETTELSPVTVAHRDPKPEER